MARHGAVDERRAMAKRKRRQAGDPPEDWRFVQTATGAFSLGVEVTHGRPWVGVAAVQVRWADRVGRPPSPSP